MGNGFDTASREVSHQWIEQLQEHLPEAARLSVYWARSSGSDWHHVIAYVVGGQEQNDPGRWKVQPELDTSTQLADPENKVPAMRIESIAQQMWDDAATYGREKAREIGKGGLRARLVIVNGENEEINDPRPTQKRIPLDAEAEEDEANAAAIEKEEDPKMRGILRENARLRKIVDTTDKTTGTRLATLGKLEHGFVALMESQVEGLSKHAARVMAELDASLDEHRADEQWKFFTSVFGPLIPTFFQDLGCLMRNYNGNDPKQCPPMPMHFALWVQRSFGPADHSNIATLHMVAIDTAPDNVAHAERWTLLLLEIEALAKSAADQELAPLEKSHASTFRKWIREVCKVLGQDARRYPFASSEPPRPTPGKP